MGRKQDVLNELFAICENRNDFIFDNNLVKKVSKKYGFGNPFDVTKLDNTEKFPKVLRDNNVFVIHLGEGKHKFIKGIKNAFHEFENIRKPNSVEWKYRKSILNEFDTSESNILSIASNQKIMHDFLYDDTSANPKIYNARRTKMSFSYAIGREKVQMENIQMEIDMTMENNGVVTVFEGKNGFPDDFAVYQIFHPFKYFSMLKKGNRLPIEGITCCYVLREIIDGSSVLRLYNYTFRDENNMASIKLLKSKEYKLIKE